MAVERYRIQTAAIAAVACAALALANCAQNPASPDEFELDESTERKRDAGEGASGGGAETSSSTDRSDSTDGDSCPAPRIKEPVERETWASEREGPADVHSEARLLDSTEHDWAPNEKDVVLHTIRESAATEDRWRDLVDDFEHDVEIREHFQWRNDRERESFGLVLDFSLTNTSTELQEGETAYFGLGGPFGRHRVHLFECGPSTGDNSEVETRAWRVGNFVVQCRYPELRYGVALDFSGFSVPREETFTKKKYYESKKGLSRIKMCLIIHPEPYVPEPYREWWRSLRDGVIEVWKEEKSMEFFDKDYGDRLPMYVVDGRESGKFQGYKSHWNAYLYSPQSEQKAFRYPHAVKVEGCPCVGTLQLKFRNNVIIEAEQ